MASKFLHTCKGNLVNFFKIITAASLQEGKLKIPNTFVKKYGEGIPNTVTLKTPNGAEWKLNLEKCDGKICFQKGWKEFAEYHSLAHGHLLLFRYQRTFHFEVHIFDSSALEIDYPLQNGKGEVASNDKGKKPQNEVNLKYHRSGQKRKDNSPVECFQPRKGKGLGSHKFHKIDYTVKLQKASWHSKYKRYKEKVETTTKQVTTFDRANCFKSCNPFFTVVMSPSYVRSGGPLHIPTMFGTRHIIDLSKNNRGDINFQVLNGRVWNTRYLIRTFNRQIRFEVTTGWKTFAKDNKLEVGDICIFELIPGTDLTFLVHIFRDLHDLDCSTS